MSRVGGGNRRLLIRYLAPQRAAVGLMAALLLGGIGLQLVEPQIIGGVIESVQHGDSQATLIRLAGLYLLVSMVRRVVTVLAAFGSERVAWRATNALRADLTAHVLRQDPHFHAAHPAGELIERIDGDVDEIAQFFSTFIIRFLGNALLAVGTVVAVTVLDPFVGSLFAAVVLSGTVALQLVGRNARVHWEENREQSGRFFGLIGELLQAAEDLRSLGAVAHAMGGFAARARSWAPTVIRSAAWGSSVWMIATAVVTVSSALAYGLGGHLFRSGVMSLGEVYLLVAYAAMLSSPLEAIQDETQYLQRASAAISRVTDLLAIRTTIVDGTAHLAAGPLAVEFDAVSFWYEGGSLGVRDLSFTVAAGQTLGLVGRTGAGKSTIAHLLFRLYDPERGSIRVGGTELRSIKNAALRARIGFVTQDVHIFDASIRDNMTFFEHDVTDELLTDIIDAVGLTAWLDTFPERLAARVSSAAMSAGQAQLIAFARVLVKDPAIVILDEPSSRLDPATEAHLERAMDRLLSGRTGIVIAHRLETIRRAGAVLVLEAGQVVEHGEPARLLADGNSRFAQLCRTAEVST